MLKSLTRFLILLMAVSVASLSAEDTASEVSEAASEASEPAPEVVDVPESELIEMVGYLTAFGGGLGTLELDEAGVDALTAGFVAGLQGHVNIMEFPREEMEAAFAQAQARAEAVESGAEELPAMTEDALTKIGMVVVLQSGLSELGFGEENLEELSKGFKAGAMSSEVDPAMEAKMPAFQAYIQPRVQKAQAAAMMEQQKAMEAQQAEQMAEFEPIAAEWRDKEPMTVVLETTQGEIEIELMPSVAPLAVANFVGHIEAGYYNDLIFHRVIPDFMIQGGDPQGTGMGGESIWGKPFPDEVSAEVGFDSEGLLAMANAGPMTNGSQFFITTSMPDWLNGKHTIFGKVTSGYEIVKRIEGVETGAQDKPVVEQKIVKAYVK